jgi:hypothetical protein
MGQKVVIEVLAGPNVGESFEFDKDQILIGRGSQCQMQLASPHVSRQQCELSRHGDQVVLENLGSVNVTYLNDRPIDRVYVQDGDLITFCDIALRVSFVEGPVQDDPDRTVAYQSDQFPPGALPLQPMAPQPIAPQQPYPPGSAVPQPQGSFPSGSSGAPVPGHAPHSVGIPTAPPSHNPGAPQQPGMPGATPSAGMPPGPPPGMPGGGGWQNQGPAQPRRRKRAKEPSKGSGVESLNLPLIRNVAVGLAISLLVVTVLGKILGGGSGGADQVAVAPQVKKEKCASAERNGRTDQEIVQDAQRQFEKGEVYFNQWQISDDSLSVALEAFCSAKAGLRLVDKSGWPAFARELDPAMAAAEEKVKREYSRLRISYNHYQQMGDLQMAREAMERALVLIPDSSDERHQFARRKINAVKAKMAGQTETHRWEDRK